MLFADSSDLLLTPVIYCKVIQYLFSSKWLTSNIGSSAIKDRANIKKEYSHFSYINFFKAW